MKKQALGLLIGLLAFALFLLIPIPFGLSSLAWNVLAVALLMVIWWVTEAVPLPVTALLPIVCFPLMNVSTMRVAAAPYASPIVYLFLGGFMLALALQKTGLHKRIALHILRITGTSANGIILGFMLATFGLSMWISNTATTIMMLPIAVSVMELLSEDLKSRESSDITHFVLSLPLAIAYAANIGGTATIIGTPPNVVLAGFLQETTQVELDFARWMLLCLPFAAMLLFIAYGLLVHVIFRNSIGEFPAAQKHISDELAKLGSLKLPERYTLGIFACTALAWIFRGSLVEWIPQLSDAIIAILATFALFAIPIFGTEQRSVLSWEDTEKLPWGILLLFGGGLSLAGALSKTELLGMVGAYFESSELPLSLLILAFITISVFLTEIMSNVALVTIFLPLIAGIATVLGVDILQLAIPITLGASCAFMLPMATPPNAIVFATGQLKVADMIKAGIFLNLISIAVIFLFVRFFAPLVF